VSSRTDYFFKYLRSLWPWFSDFGVSVSVLEPLSLGLGLGTPESWSWSWTNGSWQQVCCQHNIVKWILMNHNNASDIGFIEL